MVVTLLVALALLAAPRLGIPRRSRRLARVDEQQFYSAVHAELMAGAALRQAVARASAGQPGTGLDAVHRAAISAGPIGDVAAAVGDLPDCGRLAAAAVGVGTRTGGRAAAVFLRLAERAAAVAEVNRQRRVLTTQARLSAVVVAGLPLAWLTLGGYGQMRSLIAAGGTGIAVVGGGLELIGLVVVWRLAS